MNNKTMNNKIKRNVPQQQMRRLYCCLGWSSRRWTGYGCRLTVCVVGYWPWGGERSRSTHAQASRRWVRRGGDVVHTYQSVQPTFGLGDP